jgi:hypothetical protein
MVNCELKAGEYSGYIPPETITALSWELAGLVHGTATLTIHIRDGKMERFTTGRETSHLAPEVKA